MTQEEKAKRYDEVLEELRGLLECVREDKREILEEDITNIFPELQENEDERIRKGIIRNLEYLMDRAEGFVKDELKERIAWLEKQGKQKPTDKVEPKFKVKYAGNEYNVFETKDIAGVAFYGIEDEPNHIDYVKAENCEIISGYAIKENGSPYPTKSAVFSEQKSIWSEEDELHIRELESLVKQIWATAEHENDKETIHKMSDLSFFLTTLKPQPKQEWSEEDEYCRHQLIVFCENCMVKDDGAKRCAHWLKSLRPQNTWKPSDAQMIALNDIIINGNLSNANERILKGLQEKLKKL